MGKTQEERNAMGQFATPYPLACDIMKCISRWRGDALTSLLEPAFGTGALYSAFLEVFGNNAGRVLGFEADPYYCEPTRKLWQDNDLEIRCEDFLASTPSCNERFDIIIANPPYVRHHHINRGMKAKLHDCVMRSTGMRISGLAGLYCYFMLLSSKWLAEGGLSCWLVPCEFMDVNYGETVRRYLLECVDLLQIHRFSTDKTQFNDALVSSCVVVFRNSKPTANNVLLSHGNSMNVPSGIKEIGRTVLGKSYKWSNLFEDEGNDDYAMCPKLGDFFTVKRGIATGDNNFFIIGEDVIRKYEIPEIFLKPVLPSPRYVGGVRVTEEDLHNLGKRFYLFSCNYPEEILKKTYPKVWQYVKEGRDKGVDSGYICSRRTPWYSCEGRTPAPIVVPYMGRIKAEKPLFRFILNMSGALTTNVYLLLYPHPDFSNCIKSPGVMNRIWEELNSIPDELISKEGRVYGGGLHKIEPRELMNIPVPGIASFLIKERNSLQPSLF